jgi:hypothetical protein
MDWAILLLLSLAPATCTSLLLGIVKQTVKQALKEDIAREMTFFLTTAFARRKLVFELDE